MTSASIMTLLDDKELLALYRRYMAPLKVEDYTAAVMRKELQRRRVPTTGEAKMKNL